MNRHEKLLAVAAAAVLLGWAPVRAQDFGLGVTAAPNPVLVNNPILYSFLITNFNPFAIVNNVFVTNDLPGDWVFNAATNHSPFAVTVTPTDTNVVFYINTMPGAAVAQVTMSLTPRSAGAFTNQVTVAAFNRSNATATAITTVTAPAADLAAGLTLAPPDILTNDTSTVGLSVTNLGPNAATAVWVTNTLPAGCNVLSVAPAAFSNSFVGGSLALDLGTMTSGSSTQILVTVQPTSAGVFPVGATVASANIEDPNPANNTASGSLTVTAGLAGNLTVTVQGQQFNRQSGLLEMDVLLSNNAATNVPAARINVTGLTNGVWLYNAAGTNSGVPFVLYNTTLPGGASVPLVLEYYVLVRGPLSNYALEAIPVPALDLTAPTNTSGILVTITNTPGGILLEFPATPGKTYTIVYAADSTFSNALTAQPVIVAPANRVQWIDNGPPKTISAPASTSSRVYRVYQSP